VHVDSERPVDQLNSDNKCQIAISLQYAPLDALERTAGDTNCVALAYRGVRRKRCVLGAHPKGVHLLIIHGQRRRAVAHYIDDACGLHYRKSLVGTEADENIPRKQRMLNLPSNPILPSPDDRVER